MRIIVCGGRDYSNALYVRSILAEYIDSKPTIVHGAARGADRLAGLAAFDLNLPVEAYPARWRRDGATAGTERNELMLERGADLVIAFPGGRGTADMVRRSRDAGVMVRDLR